MSDVGLDGTDAAGFADAVGPDYRADRARLDGIAHRRTRSVCLDVGHFRGLDAGLRVRGPHHRDLRVAVGHRDSVCPAVRIGGGAKDHSVHGVSVAPGGGQRLEQEHRRAFGADIAVGVLTECLAPPRFRQEAALGHRDLGLR